MFGAAAKIIFIGFILKQVLEYRDWLDLHRDVTFSVTPGQCQVIIEDGGSEDLTHVGGGLVLLSTGLSSSSSKIQAINLNASSIPFTLNVTNPPDRHDFMAHLHGLSSWRDPQTGQLYLYVISHGSQDRVEVFQVQDTLELKYIKTITDSSFTFVNDLLVVGKDKFYITQFCHFHFHENSKLNLEWLSRWKTGKVLYFDGHRAREVATDLQQPNGINISPDGKVVYVGEFGGKILRAYRRESTNNLAEIWNKYLGTGIDNIEVDPDTGDLWIGSHPCIWKVIDLINLVGAKHPGQVLRIKMTDNAVSEIEEIYHDDGNVLSGTSVATYVSGKVLIGTVSQRLAICDVSYLSRNGADDVRMLPKSYVPV